MSKLPIVTSKARPLLFPEVSQGGVLRDQASLRKRVLVWLLRNRLILIGIAHAAVFSLAYLLAFCFRFDFDIPRIMLERFVATVPLVVGIKIVVFYSLRSFHGWWRYVTFSDFKALVNATMLSFALIAVIDYFILPFQIPRVVLILDAAGSCVLIAIARSSWRLMREGIWPGISMSPEATPAFIFSNRHETIMLALQINSLPSAPYKVVGIVCDEDEKIGFNRAGIPIVATPRTVCEAAEKFGVDTMLIVAGVVPGARLRQLRDQCQQYGLKVRVMPPGLRMDPHEKIPIRDIEIRDLLQRDPVTLDDDRISQQLSGHAILVTGAGGSIGSEICRQLLRYHPSELILLDHRENSVFLIHNELERLADGSVSLRPCVGDVLDVGRMRQIFDRYQPRYVYHAAAHKHVGLMEANVGEAIKNNVIGTKVLADLAHEFAVDKFVLISTDKAVNPTSVMGASKQIAERYVQSLAQESDCEFVVVRFGNVLGSNGSVVPLFREQIERGGPITITDERMTRFFMTIPEASQLVLQAGAMGEGGEIFVLEMGEQYPIVELAREMIRLAGLPEDAIEIKFIGSRPGEKLYEELYFDDERMLDTGHPKVKAAHHRIFSVSEVLEDIQRLQGCLGGSDDEIRAELTRIIPEYGYVRRAASHA